MRNLHEELDVIPIEEMLATQWDHYYSRLLLNLRAVRIAKNDFGLAHSIIGSEVNVVDLFAVTVLRRFARDLYEVVSSSRDALTASNVWWKASQPLSDKKEESLRIASAKLEEIYSKTHQGDAWLALLRDLFPDYSHYLNRKNAEIYQFSKEDANSIRVLEARKRIAHPDYFPIYFSYEVPSSIYSSIDFFRVMERIKSAPSWEVDNVFREELIKTEPGSLKRSNFIGKVRDEASSLSGSRQRDLALSICRSSDLLQYDMMDIGEAQEFQEIVLLVANKGRELKENAQFISQCLAASTDDTFCVRLLKNLEKSIISVAAVGPGPRTIRQGFMSRMDGKYGSPFSAANFNFSTFDPEALYRWVQMDESARPKIHSFFFNFVGTDRSRMAEVINRCFSGYVWNTNPFPFVEKLLPSDLLRQFLPYGDVDSPAERRAFTWLEKLLQGEFEGGTGLPSQSF